MSNKLAKKKLKYLVAYNCSREAHPNHYQSLIARYRRRGYHVEGFCLAPYLSTSNIDYNRLNRIWNSNNRQLFRMYRRLEKKLKEFDVFILNNGADIHGEFLRRTSTFNVYISSDDSQSSNVLSKQIAKYFDLALTGNVACINLYKSFGMENVDFLPLGFTEDDFNPEMKEECICNKERDISIIFLGEQKSPGNQVVLKTLINEFPYLYVPEPGWPGSNLIEDKGLKLFQRSKIGINLHKITGPANLNTYLLPANGVMQICDNKHMLGYLFDLENEVVGFDSVNEAIELIKYYLGNEDERKRIAINGWRRAIKDYSEEAVWERLTDHIAISREKFRSRKKKDTLGAVSVSENYEKEITIRNRIKLIFKKLINRGLKFYGYEIRRKKTSFEVDDKLSDVPTLPYIENLEKGPINFEIKEKRVKEGGPFELPGMIALNQTIVSLLEDAKKILEVGSGTGCFAWHAAMDKSRYIVASEIDTITRKWAIQNRPADNLQYVSKWLNDFKADSFDLIVAIEVIEHIKDYSTFLQQFYRVAPKAIITTPNKSRNDQSAKICPPRHATHVREWTAGEFYWVLKVFYNDVKLHSMPDIHVPKSVPIKITSQMTPLIAICKERIGLKSRY